MVSKSAESGGQSKGRTYGLLIKWEKNTNEGTPEVGSGGAGLSYRSSVVAENSAWPLEVEWEGEG
jgi:hypothetical protein